MVTEIGRSSSTGTGDVGRGYRNPRGHDVIPYGYGLPDSTSIAVEEQNAWKRTGVSFPSSYDVSRIGVFYATIERGSNRVTIPIIKMSETGKNDTGKCTLLLFS